MLRLAKVHQDSLGYYLDVAAADLEGGQGGSYLGRLARKLDLLERPADAATLPLLLRGVDPLSGELLDEHHGRVRVLAYDCTFAAPKSVSLLALLGERTGASDVVAAHERSVAAMLGYLESNCALVRRGAAREVLPAAGLAAAAFLHRTSRTNDPHLHTHLLVANLAADRAGRFSALDGRGLYAHVAAAGALYRSQLRFELSERFALAWKAEGRGFNDLSGLPRFAIEAFSTRSSQISEELARLGARGYGASTLAAHRTRPEKDRRSTFEELATEWRRRAHRVGIADSRLQSMLEGREVGRSAEHKGQISVAAEQAIAAFPGQFSRDELLTATTARLRGGARCSELERGIDALLDTDAVVALAPRGSRRGREGQIPPPGLEARFYSRENADLAKANATLLAAARPLAELVADPAAAGGVYRARDLGALARFARCCAARGNSARGVAPRALLAAHLEALTAIHSVVVTTGGRRLRGAVGPLVLFSPGGFAPREFARLLDETRAEGQPVVVAGRELRLGAAGREPEGKVLRDWVGAVEVRRAAHPAAAVASFDRLRSELEAADRSVVAISVDSQLVAPGSVPPWRARAALRQRPGAVALVLGRAGLLGSALGGIDDGRRVHVVVADRLSDAAADRGLLLEIAQPRSPDGSLLRLPDDDEEECAVWGRGARLVEDGVGARSPRRGDEWARSPVPALYR